MSRASYDAAFFDANDDGAPDILLVNTSEPENLLINTNNGQFINRSDLLTQGNNSEHDHDVCFGDLNHDGQPDALISVDNSVSAQGQPRYDAFNRIFFSTPGLQYIRRPSLLEDLRGDYLETQIADINGDGLDDVVLVDNIDQSAPILVPDTGVRRQGVVLLEGQEDGSLREVSEQVMPDLVGPAVSMALHDLDDDGDLDIAVAVATNIGDLSPGQARGQQNWLLVNRGDGVFFDATEAWPGFRDATYDIEALDVDQDDVQDLFLCNYLTPNRLYVQSATP